MAFQTIPGHLWIPDLPEDDSPVFTNMLIDASGEKAAAIVTAPKTGTIDKVGFRTRTVTTGVTVDVRLETVDATNGDPSGTLLGTNSNGSQVIADGDDNTWFLTSLTTGVTVTKGDEFAVVIANAGSGNMNITANNFYIATTQYPGYIDLFTAAWAKTANQHGNFAFEYSDGTYDVSPTIYPVTAINQHVYNSGSNPDERALKFRLPFPFQVSKAWVNVDLNENADLVLQELDSTVLQTVSLDKDIRSSSGNRLMLASFATSQALSKDTFYRLSLKPTTTTSITLKSFDVDAVAIMDSFNGGQNFHYSQRVNGGTWTDTTTRRPLIGIGIDALDDAAGGGIPNLVIGPYRPA